MRDRLHPPMTQHELKNYLTRYPEDIAWLREQIWEHYSSTCTPEAVTALTEVALVFAGHGSPTRCRDALRALSDADLLTVTLATEPFPLLTLEDRLRKGDILGWDVAEELDSNGQLQITFQAKDPVRYLKLVYTTPEEEKP